MVFFIIYLFLNGLIMFLYSNQIQYNLLCIEIEQDVTINRFYFTLLGILFFIPLMLLALIKNWCSR